MSHYLPTLEPEERWGWEGRSCSQTEECEQGFSSGCFCDIISRKKLPLVWELNSPIVDTLSCHWKSSSSLPLLGLNQGTSELQPTWKLTRILTQNKQMNSGLTPLGSDGGSLWMFNHFLGHDYRRPFSVLSLKHLRIAKYYFDEVLKLSYCLWWIMAEIQFKLFMFQKGQSMLMSIPMESIYTRVSWRPFSICSGKSLSPGGKTLHHEMMIGIKPKRDFSSEKNPKRSGKEGGGNQVRKFKVYMCLVASWIIWHSFMNNEFRASTPIVLEA